MSDTDKQVAKQEKARQQRSFIIRVLLMFLVSIVVFVIGTYYFIIPRMITQTREIAYLRTKLADVQQTLNDVISATIPAEKPKEIKD